jgi:predicted transcriptional regulator
MPRDNTMTVSLPREMLQEVDAVRKHEHRTRSELVREALRTYFTERVFPRYYSPTPRELAAIRKGRAEIRRGEYLTPDEFFKHLDVDNPHTSARAKSGKARPTTRARALARRA